jgi:hypothetical protein
MSITMEWGLKTGRHTDTRPIDGVDGDEDKLSVMCKGKGQQKVSAILKTVSAPTWPPSIIVTEIRR